MREGAISPHFPRMPMHERILISAESVPVTMYHAIGWICLHALVANAFLSALAQHLPQARLPTPNTLVYIRVKNI